MNIESLLNSIFSDTNYNIKDVFEQKLSEYNLSKTKALKLLNIDKDVFVIKNPLEAQLPRVHMSSTYVFAKEDTYFVYPNNYNQFVHYFNGTFQHGGISLEEMIIPFITYSPK